jgi:hypothetical protein
MGVTVRSANVSQTEASDVAMTEELFQAKMQLVYDILAEQWEPERMDEHSWAFRHVSGWVPLTCYTEINPELELFLFRAINTLPVEPPRRSLVAEYLTRVNYPLPAGNWAIDLDDGEVRWKAGVYFSGTDLSEPLVRNVLDSSLEFIYQAIVGVATIQTGGSLEDGLATVGQDHGRGMAEGMKQPG